MKKSIKFLFVASALGMLLSSCGQQTGPSLHEIKIASDAKVDYEYNEDFVKPTVTAIYDNASTKTVTDQCVFAGFDSSVSGEHLVSASYTEKDITKKATYLVNVSPRVAGLDHIEIGDDAKVIYRYEEDFVKPTITAVYDDETKEDVTTSSTFEGYNTSIPGVQTVTVTFMNKKATYTITVNDPVVCEKIEIVGTPKASYKFGEELLKPEIRAIYSDETTETVTEKCEFKNFDSTQVGQQTIDVYYSYRGKQVTTSFQVTIEEPVTALKFAIFADVQLTGETAIAGESVTNQGNTANAPLALKNHLQYIKDQGIEVVLMNGDITNQANEHYYEYFEKILESVYGKDESTYPEFVWNMGNHEWWWGTTEKEEGGDAVSLFKKYARINSSNLVAESKVKYHNNPNVSIPSYYKVINGVPLLVVSGENSWGEIGDEYYAELQGWLNDIKSLPSVQKGGPIFVQYHYPLTTSMTYGQGSHSEYCGKLEELLKDTPNAVVFTGDTHFPGVNERAINQVDFTTINLGTSSYSRMVDESAVICSDFDNVGGGSASSKADKMFGNIKFKEAYTPTIQVVEVSDAGYYTIDRYFTESGGNARKVGEQWNFRPIKSKENFVYTNARFQSVDAAKSLYGKEGLDWGENDELTFGVDKENRKMTVLFPDVIDHHFVEHYQIKVNGTKIYDEVSNYYKYPESRENNYYILEDIPQADSYEVEVVAYDFYDNPSTNTLISTTDNPEKCVDPIDYQATLTYTDITTRNNFQEKEEGSASSIEYYYRGKDTYNYGAILNRLICKEAGYVDCSKFLTLQDQTGVCPIVTMDVKNNNASNLVMGLTVVDGNGDWKTDFGKEYQKSAAPGEWTKLEWNLSDLFGITSKNEIYMVAIKAKLEDAQSDGYEMSFLLDNIDITFKESPTPERHAKRFEAGIGDAVDIAPVQLSESLVIDFKFDSDDGHASLMLGDGWGEYFGYFDVSSNSFGTIYNGVYASTTSDGFIRVTFNPQAIDKKSGNPQKINLVYIRGDWTTVSGYYEVNPKTGDVVRGKEFSAGKNNSTDLKGDQIKYVATDTFVLDIKFMSGDDTFVSFMLGEGWNSYFGYFKIFADGHMASAYNGVTSEKLSDGYYRYSFKLSEVTEVGDRPAPSEKITLFHVEGARTTAFGYIDICPSI
ncbi:MAG: metallophosphoesterase [Bacilli bacterium]|nr:metallophosphoesterase [Bacilli bacterium]